MCDTCCRSLLLAESRIPQNFTYCNFKPLTARRMKPAGSPHQVFKISRLDLEATLSALKHIRGSYARVDTYKHTNPGAVFILGSIKHYNDISGPHHWLQNDDLAWFQP